MILFSKVSKVQEWYIRCAQFKISAEKFFQFFLAWLDRAQLSYLGKSVSSIFKSRLYKKIFKNLDFHISLQKVLILRTYSWIALVLYTLKISVSGQTQTEPETHSKTLRRFRKGFRSLKAFSKIPSWFPTLRKPFGFWKYFFGLP